MTALNREKVIKALDQAERANAPGHGYPEQAVLWLRVIAYALVELVNDAVERAP